MNDPRDTDCCPHTDPLMLTGASSCLVSAGVSFRTVPVPERFSDKTEPKSHDHPECSRTLSGGGGASDVGRNDSMRASLEAEEAESASDCCDCLVVRRLYHELLALGRGQLNVPLGPRTFSGSGTWWCSLRSLRQR